MADFERAAQIAFGSGLADPKLRTQAEQYLSQLQQQEEGWAVALAALQQSVRAGDEIGTCLKLHASPHTFNCSSIVAPPHGRRCASVSTCSTANDQALFWCMGTLVHHLPRRFPTMPDPDRVQAVGRPRPSGGLQATRSATCSGCGSARFLWPSRCPCSSATRPVSWSWPRVE